MTLVNHSVQRQRYGAQVNILGEVGVTALLGRKNIASAINHVQSKLNDGCCFGGQMRLANIMRKFQVITPR